MPESSESFELPKNLIYPTKSDVLELERIADTKATGENIHKVKTRISEIYALFYIVEKRGWDEELLKRYDECKTKLFEILSGFPPARE